MPTYYRSLMRLAEEEYRTGLAPMRHQLRVAEPALQASYAVRLHSQNDDE